SWWWGCVGRSESVRSMRRRSRSSPPGATVTSTAELPFSATPTVAARCVGAGPTFPLVRGTILSRIAIREAGMLFMVIERFRDDDMVPIYKQLRDGGRLLPDGLKYVDSWVEPNFSRCFQLMECDDVRLFQKWVLEWRGSGVTIEIVPVVSSKETR